MGFDSPKIRPCQKISHDFCFVFRNSNFQIGLFAEKLQIINGYTLRTILPHATIPPFQPSRYIAIQKCAYQGIRISVSVYQDIRISDSEILILCFPDILMAGILPTDFLIS
jgi:hypothetical protein